MRADQPDNRTTPGAFAESVIARLRALRDHHPDAQIATELARLDDSVAVVRAAISLPNGGSASGFGSAGAGGHDAVEDAETRALHRALTVLGYAPEAPVAAPVAPPGEPVAPSRPGRESRERVTAAPEPDEPPAEPVQSAAPAREAARPEPARTAAPAARPVPAPDLDDDPPLADYSWTEFWKWARSLGYGNKQVVEELIGQSITSLSPAQVRVLLRDKTGAD